MEANITTYNLLIYALACGFELFVICPAFSYFKWSLLGHIGIPPEERELIFSSRKKGFDLEYFIDQYGDRNLRIVDGIPRKLCHIAGGLWQYFIFAYVIKDTHVAFVATLTYQIILLFLCNISYSSDKIFGLPGMLYGLSRIRDGVLGRKNILVVQLSFLNLFPLVWMESIGRSHVTNPSVLLLFPAFVFLPLTFGDALGEIIGTVWGKQKIQVWGIGQINRKSVLGSMAVLLGSLLPLAFIIVSKSLSLEWWFLCFGVAITTTVVELIAPRSTDNFFIPLANALVCGIFVFSIGP
jgi:dolichol kinase